MHIFELIFFNIVLSLLPIGLILIALRTLLMPKRHAKSFRLASELDSDALDGFISFKTNPDEEMATTIVETLDERGIQIRFIHGDSECPHPFASTKANSWIRKRLSDGVGRSITLVVVLSKVAMNSEWVRFETLIGSEECHAIIFLCSDGMEDLKEIPRLSGLPSCPIYAIDFLAVESGIDELEGFLNIFRDSGVRGKRNRTFAFLAIFSLWLLPLLVFFAPADEAVQNITVIAWWWLIIGSLGVGALFFPRAFPVSEGDLPPAIVRLRKGITAYRFAVVVSLFGYISLSLVWLFAEQLFGNLPTIPFLSVIAPVAFAFAGHALIRVRKRKLLCSWASKA